MFTASQASVLVFELVVTSNLLAGFIGMTLWKNKGGNPDGGFIVGAIFGILGVIILALAKPGRRELERVARSQAELVKREGRV